MMFCNHKPLLALTLGCALAAATAPAVAGPYTDAVQQCFANSTTGKERIDLASWVFANMALHPNMSPMANIPADKREQLNRKTADIFTKLMADACTKEIKEASKMEGAAAIKAAFNSLGQLAMQELMNNPSVVFSFSAFEQFVDQQKIKNALSQ